MSQLYTPLTLGRVTLAHRLVMSPMSRHRSSNTDQTPHPLGALYYQQRASAGLIIAEGTQTSPRAKGFPGVPGIYTPAQIAAWREATTAVHRAGGHIFLQLWHCGRVSCRQNQPGGELPIAPSAIDAGAFSVLDDGSRVPTDTPRALATEELPALTAEYVAAAQNAITAGFDGVELHAANGYLLHQFLSDASNQRSDNYGGSPENRARFVVETAAAVAAAIGADRTGIRLSPVSNYQGAGDSAPEKLYPLLIEQLSALGLGYVHMVEGFAGVQRDNPPFDYAELRRRFKGAWIANNMYDRDMAEAAIASGYADLIAFGRPFIANPDLVRRLREERALNAFNPDTLFAKDEVGYTDYPALTE